jgi:hypothetical protein
MTLFLAAYSRKENAYYTPENILTPLYRMLILKRN